MKILVGDSDPTFRASEGWKTKFNKHFFDFKRTKQNIESIPSYFRIYIESSIVNGDTIHNLGIISKIPAR